MASVFDIIDGLKSIPGFSTSKNSFGTRWLLSNGDLSIFANTIIEQYEAKKAKEREQQAKQREEEV